MNSSSGEYRDQLHRWSCMLSDHRLERFREELASDPAGAGARLYLENCTDERRDTVRRELGLASLAMPDLDVQIDSFLRSSPRTAFELDRSDAEDCLRWMEGRLPLTPRQASFVGYQLAEFEVMRLARRDRVGYVGFQRLLDRSLKERETRAAGGLGPILHANPTHVLRGIVMPGASHDAPGRSREALFFAAAGAVRCLPLAPEQTDLVRTLIDTSPCRLEDWAARAGTADAAAREVVARFAHEGFVAVTE